MEDTSLDEFLETGGEDDSETDESEVRTSEHEETSETEAREEPAGETSEGETTGETSEGEAAAITARWARTDGVCERCEESTTRLWADDGAFVCRDCKEW